MPETTALDLFKGKYCRMCGAELGQSCVSIFGEEGKRLHVSEKIRKTLSVLVLEEDLLPKKICTECCSSLEEYSHYREAVLDAQEKLSIIAKSLLLTASPQQRVPGPTASSSRSIQSSRCSSETSTKSPCQSPHGEANICKDCGRKFGNKAGLEAHVESEHPQNPVEAVEVRAEQSSRNPIDHSNTEDSPDQNSDHDHDVVTGDITTSQVEINTLPPPPSAVAIPPAVTPHNFPLPPDSSPEVVGYQCEFCEKVLASSGSYYNHKNTAHKGRKFTCPDCPYSYSQKASLTAHIRAHHTTEETSLEKTHQCDICSAKFFEKKFLTRHKSVHISGRVHECEICHKFYKTSKCLDKHIRVHTFANAFICPTCGKGFGRKSRLEDHLNTHNNTTGITCPSCSNLFNSYPNYAKHFKRKHPDEVLENGKIPSAIKKNNLNNNLVTIDTRTLQVMTSEQQEDSMDNYVTNSSVPTPLTGQNLSMTPGNSWNDSPNKQQSTLTFHQHNMNGLDLVDCAIQSALIHDELEQCSDDLPSQSEQNLEQVREPQHQQSQNLPVRESQPQNLHHLREAHQQQQHLQVRETPHQHLQIRDTLPQQHLQRETQQQPIYQMRESQLLNFQARETSQQHSQIRETMPQQHLQQVRETQQQQQPNYQNFPVRETSQPMRETQQQQHLQIRETAQQHSQQLRAETQQHDHHSHSLNQHQQHDPNQPMELCYKSLTTDAPDFQDMPMQLTKVLQQSGPLELCVRNEHEQQYNQLVSTGPSSSRDFTSRIDSIDLSVVAAEFQQQPIDLISRNEACLPNNHNINSTSLIQGNNLVDLSLRSTLQEQSTSSFIRELLDLSARSEYHEVQEQPMELNLSCSKSNNTNNLQINSIARPNTHYNHPNIIQNNNVEYSEAIFSLQNYN